MKIHALRSHRLDGTFEVSGTLTFPSEPPDPVAISGTYEVQGDQVELMTPDGSGLWMLRFRFLKQSKTARILS